MKILLDMDGVMVDFGKGVCEAHGKSNPHAEPLSTETMGKYHMDEIWNMPIDEFWEPLKEASFWENLEFMPDAGVILEACEQAVGKGNVCLLTCPTRGSGPVVGKIRWIEKNMPEYKHRFLIGQPKEFCAGPDSVLVDDSNEIVVRFAKAGGRTILVPRPWNCNYRKRHHALEWVVVGLELMNPGGDK